MVDGEEVEGDVFAQSGIESVVLPSTLREVASGTFWKCRNFRSVRFAEGLERIGEDAFRETGSGAWTCQCRSRASVKVRSTTAEAWKCGTRETEV